MYHRPSPTPPLPGGRHSEHGVMDKVYSNDNRSYPCYHACDVYKWSAYHHSIGMEYDVNMFALLVLVSFLTGVWFAGTLIRGVLSARRSDEDNLLSKLVDHSPSK